MIKLRNVVAAAALSAALAFAQGPRGPRDGNPPDPATRVQMRVDMLAQRLGLTDAQKAQATTIFTNAATAETTVQTSMRTARTALSDAVKANNSNAIDQAATTIGTLTGQMASIQGKADAAFYAILTPDQQSKFDTTRGPGGPGMMGPMGAGGGFGGRRGQGRQPQNQ
jgi:Spy/CpxP family protein refolding chaperone